VLCEATSQLRFSCPARSQVCDAFDWLCRSDSFASEAKPDLILQFGRPLTSSGFEQFLARHADVPRHVLAPHDWPDPAAQASSIVQSDPSLCLRALCAELERHRPRGDERWRPMWLEANAEAWRVIEGAFGGAALTEAASVRAVVEALPPGALLSVGNSLPVRELDWFCPSADRKLRVCSQRGANGIDGVLSAAAGAASTEKSPAALLIGDISFLHDAGGLLAASQLEQPFAIVVLNNRGGRIFEQLPIVRSAGLDRRDLEAWITPHDHALEHAAHLYGVPHVTVGELAPLRAALHDALGASGARVIEARVDWPSTLELVEHCAQEIDARLAALGAARSSGN
jgi:2-succinyl-5-enolpyruvyl-6-hydroxy-3-cyclohexene-1-carboxylate synthase